MNRPDGVGVPDMDTLISALLDGNRAPNRRPELGMKVADTGR